MATLDVPTYCGTARHFPVPNPDCAVLLEGVVPAAGGAAQGGLGGGADTNATVAARGICNVAFNSPVVIAFIVTHGRF